MYSRNNLFKRGISQRKFSYKSTTVQLNSEPFDKSCHQRPDIPLYALVEAIALMNEKNYSTEGTEREEITVTPTARGLYRGRGRALRRNILSVTENVWPDNENSGQTVSKWMNFQYQLDHSKDIGLTDINLIVCSLCGDIFRGEKDRKDHKEVMHPGKNSGR